MSSRPLPILPLFGVPDELIQQLNSRFRALSQSAIAAATTPSDSTVPIPTPTPTPTSGLKSPLDFGGRGDGVTDDTAAVAAAAALGYLFLPPGCICATAKVTITDSYFSIFGGGGLILKPGSGTDLLVFDGSRFTGGLYPGNGMYGHITNVLLHGNASHQPVNLGACLVLKNAAYTTVEDCFIYAGSGDGIRLENANAHPNADECNIINNRIFSNGRHGIYAHSTCLPVGTTIAANVAIGAHTVTPASMLNITVGATLIVANSDTTHLEFVIVTAITGSTFTATFSSTKTGPGITVVSTFGHVGDHIFALNHCNYNGGSGIRGIYLTSTVIDTNNVLTNQIGINLEAADRCTIKGNPCRNNKGNGIIIEQHLAVTYTDLVIGATSDVVTSAAHPFVQDDAGLQVAVTSGTGFTHQTVMVLLVDGTGAHMSAPMGTIGATGGHGSKNGFGRSTQILIEANQLHFNGVTSTADDLDVWHTDGCQILGNFFGDTDFTPTSQYAIQLLLDTGIVISGNLFGPTVFGPLLANSAPYMASGNVGLPDTEFLSVRWFGAVGDGVADDLVALQAAFDYGSANHCAIHVPPGLYLFSATLFVHGPICLYGEAGMGLGVPVLNYTGTGDAIALENAVAGTTLFAPVLRNLWIKPTHASGIGLRVKNVSGLILDRIVIGGVSSAIFDVGMYFQQTSIVQIIRPVISYCGRLYQFDCPPFPATDPNVHITIDGCDSFGGGSSPILFDIRSMSGLFLHGLWLEDFSYALNFDNTSCSDITVNLVSVQNCYFETGLIQTPKRIVNAVGASGKPFNIDKLVIATCHMQLAGAVYRPFTFAVASAAFLSHCTMTLRENVINGVAAETSATDGSTLIGNHTLLSTSSTFTPAMVGRRVRVTGVGVNFETIMAAYVTAHNLTMADLAPATGSFLNVWVEGDIAYSDSTIVEGEFINNKAIGDGASWIPYDSGGLLRVAGIHQAEGNLGLGDSNAAPGGTVDICNGRPDGLTSVLIRAGQAQAFAAILQAFDAAQKVGLVLLYDGSPMIGWQKALTFTNDPAGGFRWQHLLSGTESGANSGSDFAIARFTDAGAFIDAPVQINRATGLVTLTTARVLGALQLNTGPSLYEGTGSPNGVVTAVVGSLFLRVDGAAGTSLYVKESGTGNTGWVGK